MPRSVAGTEADDNRSTYSGGEASRLDGVIGVSGPGGARVPISKLQGATTGVKAYAAVHADSEELRRQLRALSDVLKAGASTAAKARRDFSDATRQRVQQAAEAQLCLLYTSPSPRDS